MHGNYSGRVFFMVMVFALAAATGCGSMEEEEEVSTVTIALAVVPTDVQCIRVTAQGSRTVTRNFGVVPGASSVLTMTSVPVGTVAFSGEAFGTGCGSVGASSVATWTSDPVSAQVTANAIANVALAMRRNGRAAISIDFEDDCNTGPRMWDFETGTAEGWAFDVVTAGTGDAHVGVPTASSALAQSGTRSLALGFNGVQTTESNFVLVKVPLCASGQALALAGKRIQAYVRLVTAAGSPPLDSGQGHLVALFTGPTTYFGGVDFSVNPATGGGDTPGSWYFVDGDLSSSFGTVPASTHIGFRFLTNGPWTGTVYVDDIQLF